MTDQAPSDFSHLTPLERHNDLVDDVHNLSSRFDGLSSRFDSFATDTTEKFAEIKQSQAELYRGMNQVSEHVIGLRSDLKHRASGLDLKGLMSIGAGLLGAAVALATLFGLTVAGILHLSSTKAEQVGAEVQYQSQLAHAEQDKQLVELRKDKEILELKMALGDRQSQE